MDPKEAKQARYLDMLAEIASMYYEHNMTQSEIADVLCISRSRISRLLKAAKEKDVVEVHIHYACERAYELEEILKRRYQMNQVIVVNDSKLDYKDSLREMGKLAAEYFDSIVKDKMTVGISWGRSISKMIEALKERPDVYLEIVQIMGGVRSDNHPVDIPELIINMARRFRAKGYRMNAPLYVSEDAARQTLMKLPIIENVLIKARRSDIVVTGVGNVSDDTFSFMWGSHHNYEDLLELRERGAVGFICAQAYDIHGKEIQNNFNKSIVGISLNDLKKVKTVMGISGGKQKANAVAGALHGKYLNVLVTDRSCAQEIIRMDK